MNFNGLHKALERCCRPRRIQFAYRTTTHGTVTRRGFANVFFSVQPHYRFRILVGV